MYSLIGGALLSIAFAYIGVGIKRIYKIRLNFFKDLVDFLKLLEREIKTMKTPIFDITSMYLNDKKGEFSKVLKRYLQKAKYGYHGVDELYQDVRCVYLSKEDNYEVASFLFSLGKNDYVQELTNIERNIGTFDEIKAKYQEELNKKGNLYYKLFVLLGIAIMIIVV